MSQIRSERIAKYFFRAGLVNMVIAIAATVPILVPELGLPLKLQIWPGTWMFVAYFTFLIAGVAGMLLWSLVYFLNMQLFGSKSVNKTLAIFHLCLFEIGVLGATALMGIFPGYTGGTLIHDGIGQFVVTRVVEWAVIPIGILLAVALIATLTGVVNIAFFGRAELGQPSGSS